MFENNMSDEDYLKICDILEKEDMLIDDTSHHNFYYIYNKVERGDDRTWILKDVGRVRNIYVLIGFCVFIPRIDVMRNVGDDKMIEDFYTTLYTKEPLYIFVFNIIGDWMDNIPFSAVASDPIIIDTSPYILEELFDE